MRLQVWLALSCGWGAYIVDAAGFTSHNLAARRASQFEAFYPESTTFVPSQYEGLAMDRPDAIQGGAPFPDYLYACGDEHDAGEEAHWEPFQAAAADYIRDTYPNWATDGRDSDGAGLVAFMMGVTSHYVVDEVWHGLGPIPSGEGLIRTVGYSDFNCTDGDLCSVAHTAVDTGGEFAAASITSLDWYPGSSWYIPTEDLVNIYAALNATGQGPLVQPEWINECALLFYAGSWAISVFGDLVHPIMAPYLGATLEEQYLDFPVGGIDDDAAWTGFMENRFADWVSNGPPPDLYSQGDGVNTMGGANKTEKLATMRVGARKLAAQKRRLSVLSSKKRLVDSMRTALVTGQNRGGKDGSFFALRPSAAQKGTYVGLRDTSEDTLTYSVNSASQAASADRRLLTDLIDSFVNDYVTGAVELLAGGASRYGENVDEGEWESVWKGLRDSMRMRADEVLLEHAVHAGAASEEAVRSMLGDSAAVQAHSDRRAKQSIHKALSTVLQSGERIALHSDTTRTVLREFSGEVGELMHGPAPHAYTGTAAPTIANFHDTNALASSRCDVLVGSYGVGRSGGPQEGSARMLFGAACAQETSSEVSPAYLDFRGGVIGGDPTLFPSYERFGFSTAAMDVNGDGATDAVICAPSFGGRNMTAGAGNYSGRCDIFLGPFAPDTADAVPVPALSIFGDKTWGSFGFTIAVGDVDGDALEDLVISAPYAGSYPEFAPNDREDISSQGAVLIFRGGKLLSSLLRAQLHDSPETVSVIASEAADIVLQRSASFQLFGKSLLVVPPNDDTNGNPLLLVGAPTFHLEHPATDVNSAVGRVYAFDLTAAVEPNPEYIWSVTGCRHAARTGHALAYSPLTGVLAIAEPAFNSTWRRDDISHTADLEEGAFLSYHSVLNATDTALGIGTVSVQDRKGTLRAGRVVLLPLASIAQYITTTGVSDGGSRDVRLCDLEAWGQDTGTTHVIEGHRMDARLGSSLAFMSSAPHRPPSTCRGVGSVSDHLVVGSPAANDGAGMVSGHDVFAEGSDNVSVKSRCVWKYQGIEEKGRVGQCTVPVSSVSVYTDNVGDDCRIETSEYSVYLGSPLANVNAGVAPDGDQAGIVYAMDMKITYN